LKPPVKEKDFIPNMNASLSPPGTLLEIREEDEYSE